MSNNSETVARLRAIIRDLSNKNKAKGDRIDNAARRLELLAEDMESGVEGGGQANGA
jgi:hypothetical protein